MTILATSILGYGVVVTPHDGNTPQVPPAAEDSSSAYYALAGALAGMALLLVALVRI